MAKTVVAIFDNYSNAENAARQIKEQGLRTDDISIVAKERGSSDKDYNTTGTLNSPDATMSTVNPISAAGNTPITGIGNMGSTDSYNVNDINGDRNRGRAVNDNISDGVVTGGILGGLAGLLIGAGSMMIPGLGIIAAAGPLTGLLSGAVTGGLVGGLVDLGIPESNSRKYETDVREGKILFSMRADEDKIDRISSILRENHAISVESY